MNGSIASRTLSTVINPIFSTATAACLSAEHGRELLAHFYNSNIQRLGGRLEAVYNCKKSDDGGQFADGMCVQDVERGIQDKINPLPWQTDTCVGDWYYKRDIQYKTPTTVTRRLKAYFVPIAIPRFAVSLQVRVTKVTLRRGQFQK